MSFFEDLFAIKTKNVNLPYFEALFVKALGGGSVLPDEYEEVKGFSMNNDCYFEIDDFYLTGADTLKFSFLITATCNVIGSYRGTTSGPNYSLYASTSNVSYLRYNATNYNSMFEADVRYDVEITPTGTRGFKNNSTWEEQEFTTVKPLCIGTTASNITTSAKFKGTFFGRICVKGRAVFIPCKRKADNVYGYYEKYSNTFYEPALGTPTPIV